MSMSWLSPLSLRFFLFVFVTVFALLALAWWHGADMLLGRGMVPTEALRIMTVHYHKSGHALSNSLIYNSLLNLSITEFQINPWRPRIGHVDLNSMSEDDWERLLPIGKVGVQVAPNIADGPPPPDNVRLIHFVREPVDMSISSYLYHRQQPTPEPWVHVHNPCVENKTTLADMEQALDLKPGTLDAVVQLCKRLHGLNKMDYYKSLTSLPWKDGLRLEVARFIVSQNELAGGDLLRMAANVRRTQHWPRLTIELGMWSSHPRETMTRFLDFIGFNPESRVHLIENFVKLQNKKMHNQTDNHVTRTHISAEERREWAKEILSDPIVGDLLKHLSGIVMSEVHKFQ